MRQITIDNPVINSPFEEPARYFKFDDEGITNEIVDGRRPSAYFVPIPASRKRGKQHVIDTEWTQERLKESDWINKVRDRVSSWRAGGHRGVTNTTARLLAYWTRTGRDKRLFFAQIEALETSIYVTEIAAKQGDAWIENDLRAFNEQANPGLDRIGLKMATGSGKTVVMAMIIAWQTLNKLANPQDARFSDAFLIVTPGITIRDRLRVLLPNDPENYYQARDIVSNEDLKLLNRAKILITNYHAFIRREKGDAGKLTKAILTHGLDENPFVESPPEMVRRVCRELGNKRKLVVLNDEAHHCYRDKPAVESEDEDKLTGEDRREAEKRNQQARVWISGLEAVNEKLGIRAIFDLSATPFYLRGSGYTEGTMFNWIVSDFSLIDAIECGIVKVPRVPVSDDTLTGEHPTYRELWSRIREDLPRKGRRTEAVSGDPVLPAELEGALRSLYSNYEKYYAAWDQDTEAQAKGATPPVLIVVCNNTNVSKLVFDWISGFDKPLPGAEPDDETAPKVAVPGNLPIFSNVRGGRWIDRPNTILVDSEQLDSPDAMSADFKKIASHEIEEFKAEYRRRFPGRSTDDLSDSDLLREVMNTVGKSGKLGEHIKCVVSVSMLTEGWDANTVTHVLGIRAFGTQLLCEQVVGRALRRRSYGPQTSTISYNGKTVEIEAFPAEYAEVYGVPFSFIPTAGSATNPTPGPTPTTVKAMPERTHLEITFPRVAGYRHELSDAPLTANFTKDSQLALSSEEVATVTENAPIVGETAVHTLDDLKRYRDQQVAFAIAKRALQKYFTDDEGAVKSWYFPQLVEITRRWMAECVTLKDNAFIQLLMLAETAHNAADKIYRSVVRDQEGQHILKPILASYNTVGSTKHIHFDTTRNVMVTREDKCHLNFMVADTDSWEQRTALALEDMPEVKSYVKNHNLGFTIPYTIDGDQREYTPDFIAQIDDGRGSEDLLNLIVEVSGPDKKDKAAKVATADTLWVPAINNHGAFGRWAFIEIRDPNNTATEIKSMLAKQPVSQSNAAS